MNPADAIAALCEQVRDRPRVLPHGARTKAALSTPPVDLADEVHTLDLSQLSGILEYEPEEFTLTALAGTPITEVADALAEHGQYLPFDPPLKERGATLGGTVAASMSGSGRYRYGGVRDFLIGVRFIDGRGRLVRGGGKVVKNAAGFDLPKLMVGSLGRLGVLVELTFKIFPQPPARQTLRVRCGDLDSAIETMIRLGREDWGCEAVDLEPEGTLWVRFAGEPEALEAQQELLEQTLPHDLEQWDKTGVDPWRGWAEMSSDEGESGGRDCIWSKIPITASRISVLEADLITLGRLGPRRYSVGGQLLWLAWPPAEFDALDQVLKKHQLRGLNLRPSAPRLGLGLPLAHPFLERIQSALDPERRFLPFA